MAAFDWRRPVHTGAVLTALLVLAGCGSSSGDPAASSTTSVQPTGTSTTAPTATTTPETTTTVAPLEETCLEGAVGSEATVVGVVDYVRIRMGPTTASDEIGRLSAGSTVAVYADELTYDGSDYWWVPVRIPAAGTCGNVAAEFLANESGRLDQQIPGVTYTAPTATGTWTYPDRTSVRDPVEGSLEGAFFTNYSVMVREGRLIDQLLADQLSEFEEFEYDYPADWNREVSVPGADRAVRLIPVASPSGDLIIDRLLIEVGDATVEASTSVYIEDADLAPVDDLQAFLDSVEIDPAKLLAAVAP